MLFNDTPTFTCLVCGKVQPRDRIDRKWCPGCKAKGVAAYKAEQRAKTGTVSIGTPLICKSCGKEFTKVHKRQRHCEPCSVLSGKDMLPAYRERKRKTSREWMKERRQRDPKAGINERMTAGIKNSLRNGKQGRSWESLVGYTVEDLMRHLERQFVKGMTWENRGDWHIDHIVPLKCFHFETPEDPEFRAAWAITNLRPLWGPANLTKAGNRQHLL